MAGLLEGKRIIVTAGVTGCGKADMLKALECGATVVAMSRKSPDAESVKAVMAQADAVAPGKSKFVSCDVSNRESVEKAFAEAVEWMGGLDGVVNPAAVSPSFPAEVMGDDLDFALKTNLYGTVYTNQVAYGYLRQNESGGSIVNYTSIAGITGEVASASYSISKAGIIAWTRCAAKSWGADLVRINCVAPAALTEAYQAWLDGIPEHPEWQESYDAMLKDIHLGHKLETPDKQAGVVAFLLSDLSCYMTGQILPADGGQVLVR